MKQNPEPIGQPITYGGSDLEKPETKEKTQKISSQSKPMIAEIKPREPIIEPIEPETQRLLEDRVPQQYGSVSSSSSNVNRISVTSSMLNMGNRYGDPGLRIVQQMEREDQKENERRIHTHLEQLTDLKDKIKYLERMKTMLNHMEQNENKQLISLTAKAQYAKLRTTLREEYNTYVQAEKLYNAYRTERDREERDREMDLQRQRNELRPNYQNERQDCSATMINCISDGIESGRQRVNTARRGLGLICQAMNCLIPIRRRTFGEQID